MAKELEMKLSLGQLDQETVLASLSRLFEGLGIELGFHEKILINTYFDTEELSLNKRRIALRIRQVEGEFIQTLKTKGTSTNGLSERGEWEWSLAENDLNTECLGGLDAWPAELSLDCLEPVFTTNFTRMKSDIDYQGALIELAYDHGEVSYQQQTTPINELELELKEGDVSGLLALAKLIQNDMNLLPSDISKAERGYQLFNQTR